MFRLIFGTSLVLLTSCTYCLDAHAQGGRGKGGGFKHSRAQHGSGASVGSKRQRFWKRQDFRTIEKESVGKRKTLQAEGGDRLSQDRQSKLKSPTRQYPGEEHPRDMQRLVEDRKLEHRRQIADHLREISERNGNDQLNEVADRLEQGAQEHYEKRLQNINAHDSLDEAFDAADAPGNIGQSLSDDPPDFAGNPLGELDDVVDNPPDVASKLTGRENALYRQLRNEERKLAHQMQVAERLRNLSELNGDEHLLEAADRLEEKALTHYTKRLAKITEF